MKLLDVLSQVSQNEKISFLKILDQYSEVQRDKDRQIDTILSASDNDLEKADDAKIVELFSLLRDQYHSHLESGIRFSRYQLDLAVEIFIRDDNQMISREQYQKLYNQSFSTLIKQTKEIHAQLNRDKGSLSPQKRRDYVIFRNCVVTAYENDLLINRNQRISYEENTILKTLAKSLGLSTEEKRALIYTVITPKIHKIDEIINELEEIGILFFHQDTDTIFIPDEIAYELQNSLNFNRVEHV